MYQVRYIAFIDILGFKDIVYQTYQNEQEFIRLKEAMEHIQNVKNEQYATPLIRSIHTGMEFSLFSDSIVISYPVYEPGNAFYILIDIAYICLDLLDKGYVFRGGITVGPLFHQQDMCFGPAMNKAAEMEKKACFPRIIVDELVICNGLKNPGEANSVYQEKDYLSSLISQDGNKYILDYLSLCDDVGYENYISLVCKTKKMIIDQYKQACQINDVEISNRIKEKYRWFASYYNSTVLKVIGEYEELLIDLNCTVV